MIEECEHPAQMLVGLSPLDASRLRMYTLEQVEKARERLGDDIERELRVSHVFFVSYSLS